MCAVLVLVGLSLEPPQGVVDEDCLAELGARVRDPRQLGDAQLVDVAPLQPLPRGRQPQTQELVSALLQRPGSGLGSTHYQLISEVRKYRNLKNI